MYNTEVIQITQQALWLVLTLAGPPVIVASVVGLLIALVQAATQLQEQTFQYAAKFFAIVLTIFVTSSMLGGGMYHYADKIFTDFVSLSKE
jgi:type III secretion HrpO family protein